MDNGHWRIVCWDYHEVPYKADWFMDWEAMTIWLQKNQDALRSSRIEIRFIAGMPGRDVSYPSMELDNE